MSLFEFCWLWIFPWIKHFRYSCSIWDKLERLNWFKQYLCEGLSFFNSKGYIAQMYSLVVYVKEGFAFAWDSSLENSEYSYLCFQLAFFCSVFYFFSIYQSMSSCLCSILDAISSSIDEILSMNPSANVFVFGDFNVHHNDSLTYFDGADRLYICSTEAFSWLGNCDQVFWLSFYWLSIRFKRDAPFYCTDGDNSHVNWDNLCDH